MVWRQASRTPHGVVGLGVVRSARQCWRATATSATSKSKAHGSTKWHIAHHTPLLWSCVTEQPNPDLHSNPRPRLSAGEVAAVMCPRVAQTSAQSVIHVARVERRADGRRRPKKSPSSGAGRRAATTTPTKRNRATAMSATTSNRFTAADHIHTHACNDDDDDDTSLAR